MICVLFPLNHMSKVDFHALTIRKNEFEIFFNLFIF